MPSYTCSAAAGRLTPAQKVEIVQSITAIHHEEVWVYLSDIPAHNIAEYGRVLPAPGGESAWFATLPAALRERLGSVASEN